jgi:hypothetical protein
MVQTFKGLQHLAQTPQGNYPFWIIYWLFIKLMETRVEVMRVHNGGGSSITILTGTNVIDIVPSEYSI